MSNDPGKIVGDADKTKEECVGSDDGLGEFQAVYIGECDDRPCRCTR